MPRNIEFTSTFPNTLNHVGNMVLDRCSYILICISELNFPTLRYKTTVLGYFSYID